MPAADAILQRLRQVPMIQRRIGFDAVAQQLVNQAIVEIEAFGVGRPIAFGKNPRPCDRKAIGLDAELFYQADVFLVAVIVIVGAIGRAVIGDPARRVGEGVPDRTAPAVFGDRALDLIGRGRRAPHKAVRETRRRMAVRQSFWSTLLRLGPRRRHCERGRPCKFRKRPTREFSEHRLLPSGWLPGNGAPAADNV